MPIIIFLICTYFNNTVTVTRNMYNLFTPTFSFGSYHSSCIIKTKTTRIHNLQRISCSTTTFSFGSNIDNGTHKKTTFGNFTRLHTDFFIHLLYFSSIRRYRYANYKMYRYRTGQGYPAKKTLFQIHDILGWIRILGSMLLTNGSGSCYFRH
jgi:hypothetical protein